MLTKSSAKDEVHGQVVNTMTLPTSESEIPEQNAVRFRVYPSRIQGQVLKRCIGTQRYLYNRKVEELEYQLTSTECPKCHHKDKRNRLSQADFECVKCRYQKHADTVGGINVQDRAFQKITEISPGTSLKKCSHSREKRLTPAGVLSV